ncbi:hypothetical protein EN912_36175, partial [Mesorhizobium sp. M7A.F.Ca.CA.004.02.1.1]
AAGYGWTVPEASFDWQTLVANKDREISRLEAIYVRNVEGAGGVGKMLGKLRGIDIELFRHAAADDAGAAIAVFLGDADTLA